MARGKSSGVRPAPTRFAWPRAAAHWLLAILIVILLASGFLGLARTDDGDAAKIVILRAHILFGLGAFAALALYWTTALATMRPPKASSGHVVLDALAALVHVSLPLGAFIMIASGVATVWLAQLGEVVFAGKAERIPDVVRELSSFQVHAWVARVLLGLLVLHILGSFYHQFALRDDIFSRMTLGRRK